MENQMADQPTQPQTQQVQVQIKDDKAHVVYSNVARAAGTPDELFIDFAIHVQNPENPAVSVMEVNTRVLMNYYAAKRLVLQLSQIVQRHEQMYGPLELDPRRRIKSAPPA